MKNIKEVCIHQIQDNIKDLKFVISFSLIIILMILNGIVFSLRMEEKNNEYLRIIQLNEMNIKNSSNNLNNSAFSYHLMLKKPLYSEFIVDGKQNIFPDAFFIKVDNISLPEKVFAYNERLQQIPSIDWSFIISILFSFLIFILTYDAISGEKEKRTLQLLFSNSITKTEYLFGKIIGVTLSVMMPLIVGILLNLAVIFVLGNFPITAVLMIKIALFIFYSIIFIVTFVSIGLFISSISRNSLTSLIILALFWIVSIIITPVVCKMIITNRLKVTNTAELDKQLKEAESRLPDLYAIHQAGERGPIVGRIDNYKLERGAMDAKNEINAEKQKIVDEFLRIRINQAKSYYNLINLSPVYLFQHIIENLFNTGLNRDISLIDQAKKFQRQIISYYKEADMKDANSPHLYFFYGYLSTAQIDYNLLPKFKEGTVGLSQSIMDGIALFILILTEFLIVIIFICFTFQRMSYL
jgi:ABC-type transport system involved in multi-copper enzyme maturation permease subunit